MWLTSGRLQGGVSNTTCRETAKMGWMSLLLPCLRLGFCQSLECGYVCLWRWDIGVCHIRESAIRENLDLSPAQRLSTVWVYLACGQNGHNTCGLENHDFGTFQFTTVFLLRCLDLRCLSLAQWLVKNAGLKTFTEDFWLMLPSGWGPNSSDQC